MTKGPLLRGAALLALTFAAGVAGGIGYERHHRAHGGVVAGRSATLHAHVVKVLGLNASQDSAIQAIVARHQLTVDSSWQVLQPRVRGTLDSAFREMEAVLTPAQAAKFRSLVAEMHPSMHR
jgi:hypothetical protein